MSLQLSRLHPCLSLLLIVGVLTSTPGCLASTPAPPVASPNPANLSPTPIAKATSIPPEIVDGLRQDLSQRTGVPANQLKLVESSAETWTDGCLGLAQADEMCTQAMVNGWRVVFTQGDRQWVYRTNGNGRTFRLEPQTTAQTKPLRLVSKVNRVQPAKIPIAELPPRLEKNVVFRAIASGGFTGQTIQTTLYRDGRLARQQGGSDRPLTHAQVQTMVQEQTPVAQASLSAQVQQVPLERVRQFMQVLRQNRLHKLDRADFRATPGSADVITTTLSCQSCTIRYADSIQAELPTNLQTVIQAWHELTRTF